MKQTIQNPLDALFNTAPFEDTTEDDYIQTTEGTLAEVQPTPEVDPEDKENDARIDNVYTAAIDAFNQQTQYQEIIEPRYAARNAEVAANFLTIALNAAATKARVRGDRKKQSACVPFTNNKSSNVVVASREDILRMISIDGETRPV